MQRKIPLLPTWLFFGAFLGPIFVRKVLLDRGVTPDSASSISMVVAVLLVIAAGGTLYLMRGELPSTPRKPRRRLWRRRRTPARDTGGGDVGGNADA